VIKPITNAPFVRCFEEQTCFSFFWYYIIIIVRFQNHVFKNKHHKMQLCAHSKTGDELCNIQIHLLKHTIYYNILACL